MIAHPMSTEAGTNRSWLTPAVLLIAMAAVAGAYAFAPRTIGTTRGLSDALVAVACLVATIVIARRKSDTEEWRSARFLAFGTLSLAGIAMLFAVQDLRREVDLGPNGFELLFVLVALVFLVPIGIEYTDHFVRDDRREIGADVALISAALGTILFLVIRPENPDARIAMSAAVFAAIAAGGIAAYGALALWVPSTAHVGQFVVVSAFSVSVLVFGQSWVNGSYDPGSRPIDMPFALGALALAIRILVNQVRSTHATRAVRDALDQKEVALRETDKALARLQRANETLRESEERLRLVFEAAVDGIVELDDRDLIVRANEAFCRMIDLPRSHVEGQSWGALSAAISADDAFAALPTTGQGTLRREGNPIYFESRISEVPGDHPRRLLLVRDVTAARIADQTIRSLFKFLQDRDEDRTRIMRRTNAAIESERNRIARDLHDGPVQGVSAASLSLE